MNNIYVSVGVCAAGANVTVILTCRPDWDNFTKSELRIIRVSVADFEFSTHIIPLCRLKKDSQSLIMHSRLNKLANADDGLHCWY